MASPLDLLLEALGGTLTPVAGAALLNEVGGCLQTAVAIHFSRAKSDTTADAPTRTADLAEIKAILQGAPNIPGDEALRNLLCRTDGNLDLAVSMFLDGEGPSNQQRPPKKVKSSSKAAKTVPLGKSVGPSSLPKPSVVAGSQGLSQAKAEETSSSLPASVQTQHGTLSTGPSKHKEQPGKVANRCEGLQRVRPKRQVTKAPSRAYEEIVRASSGARLSDKPQSQIQENVETSSVAHGGIQLGKHILPLADFRQPEKWALHAPYGSELPDRAVPPVPVKFPVYLGAFCLPLTKAQITKLRKGSGFLVPEWSYSTGELVAVTSSEDVTAWGYLNRFSVEAMEWSRQVKDAAGLLSEVEGAVARLQDNGLIGLDMVVSGLSDTVKGKDIAKPEVQVRLMVTEQACFYNEADGVGYGVTGRWTKKRKDPVDFVPVVNSLLSKGVGLVLGLDSDGLLNLGPEPYPVPPPPVDGGDQFDLFHLLSSLRLPEEAPLAAQPPQLLTHPKKYQLQGLNWLLRREGGGENCTSRERRNVLHLHPCWLQLLCPDGNVLYMHRELGFISENFYVAPSEGTCGGLLCDEMGLGKTLEVLMLMLANPPPKDWPVTDSRKWQPEQPGEPMPIKATLVIVPGSLLEQWQREVELHLRPGSVKLLLYDRSQQLDHLEGFDVILTSYEVLRKELSRRRSKLLEYGFWRVVLDEAQLVANSNSVAATTCCMLYRRHAWVVTGTPITAKLDEMKGLLDFLAVVPFGDPAVFNSMLQRPFERRTEEGLLRFKALLRSIMLRRTKDQVAAELTLPPCTREDRVLSFSSAEASYYERILKEYKQSLEQLKKNQNHRAARLAAGFDPSVPTSKVTGRVLADLTRLRQSCCHPQIVRKGNEFLGHSRLSMPQILGKLVDKARSRHDSALRELLLARVALAASTARLSLVRDKVPEEAAAELAWEAFAPLLEEIKANAVAVLARSQVLKGPSEKAPGVEVAQRRRAVEEDHWRLELAALHGFTGLLGDSQGEKQAVIQAKARLAELEVLLRLDENATVRRDLGSTRASKRKLEEALGQSSGGDDSALQALIEGPVKTKAVASLDRNVKLAQTAVERSAKKKEKAEHEESHLESRLEEVTKGKGKAPEEGSAIPPNLPPGGHTLAQEDKTVCPICLDSCEDHGALTACGHYFCSDCIKECVMAQGSSAPCPLCRTTLTLKDVFDTCKEEDVILPLPDLSGEFGTKVSALMLELLSARETGAKCVIFSSWKRLLDLVGEALRENNFRFAYLTGDAEERQRALHNFNTRPDTSAILVLMGNSGGAAGLTLTSATTAYIMEPSLNPGAEAQAAARIHRLSQQKPTRVVRLVVDKTIEMPILKLQKKKLEMAGSAAGAVLEQLKAADLLMLMEGVESTSASGGASSAGQGEGVNGTAVEVEATEGRRSKRRRGR